MRSSELAPVMQARTVRQYLTNRSRADRPVHQRAHQWDHFSITLALSAIGFMKSVIFLYVHYMQPYELLFFVKVYYVCKQRSTRLIIL